MIGIFAYLLISILVGIVFCFYGKKLYFPILKTCCVLIVTNYCFNNFKTSWQSVLLSIIFSFLLIILVKKIYQLGFFFLGSIIGVMLGLMLTELLAFSVSVSWLVVLTSALTLSVLTMKWSNFFIIVLTAYSGAFLITTSLLFILMKINQLQYFIYVDGSLETMIHLAHYINNEFLINNTLLIFIGTFIFTLNGIFFQRKRR